MRNPETTIDYRTRATAPPRRRRPRWPLVVVCLSVGLLVIVVFMPSLNVDGGMPLYADVTVTDAVTGRPVAGATVMSADRSGTPLANFSPPVLTDPAGRASCRVMAGFGGGRSPLYEHRVIGTSGESAMVTAPGYAATTVPFPRSLSQRRILSIGSDPRPQLAARLQPVVASQPAPVVLQP